MTFNDKGLVLYYKDLRLRNVGSSRKFDQKCARKNLAKIPEIQNHGIIKFFCEM